VASTYRRTCPSQVRAYACGVSRIPASELIGGRLCLDFVNAADVDGYADALAWFGSVEVSLPRSTAWLARSAARRTAEASAAAATVNQVRESLRGVLLAAVEGRAVNRRSLSIVNESLASAHGHHRLIVDAEGKVAESWSTTDDLTQLLFPVAIDAWDLLTEPELARVRQCPLPDGCGRLFLDTTRSRTRRWCSMATCGNRAKNRTYHERGRTRG
jgi:predicted RNA-binding Zn ribbon-like protein